ncbi:hypothetical protein [Kitasatospora sp. NPDC002040]|uniref:hypothetical protein n=1 Tax=Kitasatospora sp. NPDC002040 TaxID=3154661 RepID=UPI003318F010
MMDESTRKKKAELEVVTRTATRRRRRWLLRLATVSFVRGMAYTAGGVAATVLLAQVAGLA